LPKAQVVDLEAMRGKATDQMIPGLQQWSPRQWPPDRIRIC
jgi:hypothetical protein